MSAGDEGLVQQAQLTVEFLKRSSQTVMKTDGSVNAQVATQLAAGAL